jgi:hypothetical protein
VARPPMDGALTAGLPRSSLQFRTDSSENKSSKLSANQTERPRSCNCHSVPDLRLYSKKLNNQVPRTSCTGTGVDEVAVIGLSSEGSVVFKCRAGT